VITDEDKKKPSKALTQVMSITTEEVVATCHTHSGPQTDLLTPSP